MIAKDKAYEITLRFQDNKNGIRKDKAKQFALITVDEIVKALPETLSVSDYRFWHDVKKEINEL